MAAQQTFNASSVTPQQIAAVQSFMSGLSAKPGYQEGVTNAPGNVMKTFEVSSWVQIPAILKALETHGTEGIKIVFPEPPAGASPAVVAAIEARNDSIKSFLKDYHSKPRIDMLQELVAKIESSVEFSQALGVMKPTVTTGHEWIAAFQLDMRSLEQSLHVTDVVKVTQNGMVPAGILAHHATAKSAGREVVYELDGSQGAASVLYEALKSERNPVGVVWCDAVISIPASASSTSTRPAREVAINAFMAKEAKKAPILQDIDTFTAPHNDVYFKLSDIRMDDFDAVDRNGKTVLDHLNRILQARDLKALNGHTSPPLTPALFDEWKAHLLAAAVERLHHPGVANQNHHGTCGAESIIRLAGFRNPGEWAKLVADLVVDGEYVLSSGKKLKPADDWMCIDLSKSREAFDALLQSSLMRYVAEADGKQYRNSDDKFILPNGTAEDGDMPDARAEELISEILKEKTKAIGASTLRGAGTTQDLADRLGKLAESIGGIYMGMYWPAHPDAHAVVLQRFDPVTKRVIFSNPHGKEVGRRNGDKLSPPERYIVDNEVGLQAMPLAEFERMFIGALLPDTFRP